MDIKQIESAVNTADALYQEAVAEIDDNNYYQAIEKLEECKGAYLEILQYIDESNSDYKNIAKSISNADLNQLDVPTENGPTEKDSKDLNNMDSGQTNLCKD